MTSRKLDLPKCIRRRNSPQVRRADIPAHLTVKRALAAVRWQPHRWATPPLLRGIRPGEAARTAEADPDLPKNAGFARVQPPVFRHRLESDMVDITALR